MTNNSKSINLMSLIALIGGVLAIVGFFLTVATIQIDAILTTVDMDLTGSEVMNFNIDGHKAELTAMAYMPLLALIFGVLTILVSIIPMFTDKLDMKVVSVLQLLFGLLTTVFAAVFAFCGCGAGLFGGDWNSLISAGIDHGVVKMMVGAGTYVALAGGIVSLLGGLVNLSKSR